MDLNELKRAAAASEKYERANRDLAALAEYSVVGMVVDRGIGPIRIERGGSGGTGTVSHIGWADDLQKALTEAMYHVFTTRMEDARAELSRLGVSVAA